MIRRLAGWLGCDSFSTLLPRATVDEMKFRALVCFAPWFSETICKDPEDVEAYKTTEFGIMVSTESIKQVIMEENC